MTVGRQECEGVGFTECEGLGFTQVCRKHVILVMLVNATRNKTRITSKDGHQALRTPPRRKVVRSAPRRSERYAIKVAKNAKHPPLRPRDCLAVRGLSKGHAADGMGIVSVRRSLGQPGLGRQAPH